MDPMPNLPFLYRLGLRYLYAEGEPSLLFTNNETNRARVYGDTIDDQNPPVHAWAVWQVYHIDKTGHGRTDRVFLEKCFHKLLMNFSWWVNKVDSKGNNVFEGGFLGLDNITVLDRGEPLPGGAGAIGCDRMDGAVLPQFDAHRAGTGEREQGLRKSGYQILSALRVYRRGDETYGGRARLSTVG